MYNNVKLLLFSITLFAFASCNKGLDNTNTNSTLVRTYTEDFTQGTMHSVVTYNLNYDASNRITSVVSTSNAGDKFIYQYNTNNTFTMDIYSSNVLMIHQLIMLNSNSLFDSTFQYNNTHDSTTEKYLYNSSNQLTKKKTYDYSLVTGVQLNTTNNYTYDATGNVLTDTENGVTTTYTYYTNLLNTMSLNLSNQFKTTNLIKTSTQGSGSSAQVVNYTYTFDSNNRLSTEKQTGTGFTLIKTYTY